MPKISIIVPVYKSEAFLNKCLDSIKEQIYIDWECLLIDDGSPDCSGQICDEYAKLDNRFIVFHISNSGVSAARNIGLDNSSGEWIIFVDSDDWIEKDCLSNCCELIQKQQIDIAQFGYRKVKFSGELISEHIYTPKIEKAKDYARLREKNVCVGGSIIKASIIQDNKIRFKTGVKYAEDQMFIMNCMKFAENILYHDKVYYNYHVNIQSAVHCAKIEDKISACYEIRSFSASEAFYEKWRDNLFFTFVIDFVINYGVDDVFLKNILNDFRLQIKNLYGIKRKLIYTVMIISPFVSLKIIKNILKR